MFPSTNNHRAFAEWKKSNFAATRRRSSTSQSEAAPALKKQRTKYTERRLLNAPTINLLGIERTYVGLGAEKLKIKFANIFIES